MKSVQQKLLAYKRKKYQNQLIKGSIFAFALLLCALLTISSLEYIIRFPSSVRAILFFVFLSTAGVIAYFWLFKPLYFLLNPNKYISDDQAASEVGQYFPQISDKLLNLLQLKRLSSGSAGLLEAGIAQKQQEVANLSFAQAIKYNENKKYLKYLVVPAVICFVLAIMIPQLFTESTKRIVQFNKEFVPVAPFKFELVNDQLVAFKNEDFKIELNLTGEALPDQAFVYVGDRRIKMASMGGGSFEYILKNILQPQQFYFEAAGFSSISYALEVVHRPNLRDFIINLDFPAYLNLKSEKIQNTGHITVPAGTNIEWLFHTNDTDKMQIVFADSNQSELTADAGVFRFSDTFFHSTDYQLKLSNPHSHNLDQIQYNLEVIPDQYPRITLEQFQDTTLYNMLILGGNIEDDYGLHQLKLFYRTAKQEKYKSIPIAFDQNQTRQSYYYQWPIHELELQQGDLLEYYVMVWDNDGIMGPKSSKTGTYKFEVPSQKEIKEKIEKSSQATQKQMDKNLEQAKALKEQIKEAEERIRGKNDLTWQDKKLLEKLIEQKEELEKSMEELQKQHELQAKQQERFGQKDKKIQEKMQALQELMNELLDEETKKLYEELKKLLEENNSAVEVQDLLQQMEQKEVNLEKEIERSLALFKQLKFDSKLQESIDQLNEISKKQEELAQQTENKQNDQEELMSQQQELNKEFEQLQEEMKELKELNEELENPKNMEETAQKEQDIKNKQQESQESLEKNKRKKASEQQKDAAEQMEQLAQQMQQMQNNMEMEMVQENMDDLRTILNNLIKLSFDQEDIMMGFREVDQIDPRYVELSRQQLKIKDDAKLVEDSLFALAKRVFQLQSFVTREVAAMNQALDESVNALRERKKYLATGKQQFAMTAMNNLALMLDDVLDQMQQQMANASQNQQMCEKQGQQQQQMSMSQLQQQLNQQIQQLKKSGKSGRQLSEELAKLAAEQERIRQMMNESGEKTGAKPGQEGEESGGSGGSSEKLKEIAEQMEQTEEDLVNKRITNEMIERQQDILTRLLEAEKASRERELDEEREAEQAKARENSVPKAFEKYIKLKEKEIELLKTLPPALNLYYKKEVNNYFRRIGE